MLPKAANNIYFFTIDISKQTNFTRLNYFVIFRNNFKRRNAKESVCLLHSQARRVCAGGSKNKIKLM